MDKKQEVLPTRRRRHSAEFKQMVIQACREPGVSIAAVALHYRLNANLLRRWVGTHAACDTAVPTRVPVIVPSEEFVPLPLETPPAPTTPQDIVIEVRRGAARVTVRWPRTAAAECAHWLQGWLR